MPGFFAHSLDPAAARVEVASLRALLVENADLKESVVRIFFRERPNAPVLIGHYNPAVQRADRLAYEWLRWRREHVIVNSKRIIGVTYDQLLDDLEFRLEWLGPAAEAGD